MKTDIPSKPQNIRSCLTVTRSSPPYMGTSGCPDLLPRQVWLLLSRCRTCTQYLLCCRSRQVHRICHRICHQTRSFHQFRDYHISSPAAIKAPETISRPHRPVQSPRTDSHEAFLQHNMKPPGRPARWSLPAAAF